MPLLDGVTAFSIALRNSLNHAGLTRKDLLCRAGIEAPSLSKYLSGKLLPKPAVLAKIMSSLPAQQAAKVFSAYLREVFPKAAFDQLVEAEADPAEKCLTRQTMGTGEDPELQEVLDLLGRMAGRRPEIKALLKAILDALK